MRDAEFYILLVIGVLLELVNARWIIYDLLPSHSGMLGLILLPYKVLASLILTIIQMTILVGAIHIVRTTIDNLRELIHSDR